MRRNVQIAATRKEAIMFAKIYEWAEFPIESETLEKAFSLAQDDPCGFASHLAEQFETDCDGESEKLFMLYRAGTEDERKLINAFCVSLCGYSFPTLTKQYLERKER